MDCTCWAPDLLPSVPRISRVEVSPDWTIPMDLRSLDLRSRADVIIAIGETAMVKVKSRICEDAREAKGGQGGQGGKAGKVGKVGKVG
jgi:hypothetical protein